MEGKEEEGRQGQGWSLLLTRVVQLVDAAPHQEAARRRTMLKDSEQSLTTRLAEGNRM